MFNKHSAVFVDMSDIVLHFLPNEEDQEAFYDNYMNAFTFGDVTHSLVNANHIFFILMDYYNDNLDPMTEAEQELFWELVGIDSFVDLEN